LLNVGQRIVGHADSRPVVRYPRDTVSYRKWWRGPGISFPLASWRGVV